MKNTALITITKITSVYENSYVLISFSPHILSHMTCSHLHFSSQFYNVLRISQILRIDEMPSCIIYIKKDFTADTAFFVFQFIPVAVPVPDSGF